MPPRSTQLDLFRTADVAGADPARLSGSFRPGRPRVRYAAASTASPGPQARPPRANAADQTERDETMLAAVRRAIGAANGQLRAAVVSGMTATVSVGHVDLVSGGRVPVIIGRLKRLTVDARI